MENNDILLVKNYQTDETIRRMYEKSFGNSSSGLKISRLSGGLKNAVYSLEKDGRRVVLKIAPKDESRMLSLDRNTFGWEANMIQRLESLGIPTPSLLDYDDSLEICDVPYIFMTYIEGQPLLDTKKDLSIEQIARIEYDLGSISYKISSIKRDKFFLPSHPNITFSNNYEFIRTLFQLLLKDAKSKNLMIDVIGYDDILKLIELNKDNLNNISSICLTHCDLWDGNILIKDGKISGILDFADMYFCDELMTFYFHTIDKQTSANFLRGFNQKVLTIDAKVRIEIYRLYVLLKMIVDVEFKGYGRYDWMYEKFNNQYKKVRKL